MEQKHVELSKKIIEFANSLKDENELKASLYYIAGSMLSTEHKEIMLTSIITTGLKLHDDLLLKVGNLN